MSKKLSIIVPVYFNEKTLRPLYEDLKEKVFPKVEAYEVVFVDDGSGDGSYRVIEELTALDGNVKNLKLSRNFGSHAAILAGLQHCTGDCAVIKAADLQEPSELLVQMYESWTQGNNIVLAIREKREDPALSKFFAGLYYGIIRKIALPNMPKGGFDIFLVDRKVITVLGLMDEKNTSIVGQVLWCGFQTSEISYVRQSRKEGKSRWTFAKKFKLVLDSILGFSYFPLRVFSLIGVLMFLASIIYLIVIVVLRLSGRIEVAGWSALMILSLFSTGMIMLTLGIIGEYVWRSLDAARKRPNYIVEKKDAEQADEEHSA